MSTEKNQPGNECSDCPPVGYPTDKTRCDPCPRHDAGMHDALKNACDRLQSFLDTFGDLGDCVTDADLNDWRSALSLRVEQRGECDGAINALREWHKFQSTQNTSSLYNVASKLFGAKFDPTEYDNVE